MTTEPTVEALLRQAHSFLGAAGIESPPSKITRIARDFIRMAPPVDFLEYLVLGIAPRDEARRRELLRIAGEMQKTAAPSVNRGVKSYHHINTGSAL